MPSRKLLRPTATNLKSTSIRSLLVCINYINLRWFIDAKSLSSRLPIPFCLSLESLAGFLLPLHQALIYGTCDHHSYVGSEKLYVDELAHKSLYIASIEAMRLRAGDITVKVSLARLTKLNTALQATDISPRFRSKVTETRPL